MSRHKIIPILAVTTAIHRALEDQILCMLRLAGPFLLEHLLAELSGSRQLAAVGQGGVGRVGEPAVLDALQVLMTLQDWS